MKFEDIIKHRPDKVQGTISPAESKFIYDLLVKHKVETCLEIGVASGCSSAIIVGALDENKATGKVNNYVLYSYDLLRKCYWDDSLEVGYGGRIMLKNLVDPNWVLRTQATFMDLDKYHLKNSFDFIFIDAEHKHPWPAIDMLGCLPYIKEGGIICLHDINLTKINPQFPGDGVQTLFYNLDCEKFVIDEKIPNIGAVVVKNDRYYLENQLVRIIKENPWKTKVTDNVINKLDIVM